MRSCTIRRLLNATKIPGTLLIHPDPGPSATMTRVKPRASPRSCICLTISSTRLIVIYSLLFTGWYKYPATFERESCITQVLRSKHKNKNKDAIPIVRHLRRSCVHGICCCRSCLPFHGDGDGETIRCSYDISIFIF